MDQNSTDEKKLFFSFAQYTLKPILKEDAPAFFNLIENNRGRLENYFSGTVAKTKSIESTRAYLDEMLEKISRKMYYTFLISDNHHKVPIGYIDVKNIDWNIPKAELGCYIDAAYEGKGISGKAFQTVVDYLMKDLGMKKLFLRTHQDNIAMRKLAEKCGFEVEGLIRKDYKTSDGVLVDLLLYGKI